MEQFRYAYLVGSLLFGIPWLFIFFQRPDLRKQQLIMSFCVCLFATSEQLDWGNYWRPQFLWTIPGTHIGIESLIVGFFYGGISSSLYELVFLKKLKVYKKHSLGKRIVEMALVNIVSVSVFVVSWLVFHMNVVHAITLMLFAIGGIICCFHRNLFKPALINGLMVAVIAGIVLTLLNLFFEGIINQWWQFDLISGVRFLGIPLEEYVWHFSIGFAMWPLWKAWEGYQCFDLKQKKLAK